MSILSWNCRGLGRSQDLAIPHLKEIRKKYFPEVIFLMETKQSKKSLVELQVTLGFDKVYTVEPVGLSGGLALLWSQKVCLEVKYADKNLIDVAVVYDGKRFFISFVYGEPDHFGKEKVWERIMRLGVQRRECWSMVGDFNEILHNKEKSGGPLRSERSFEDFRNCLDVCEMVELCGVGDSFTWAGKRWQKYVQCKLDRCFGNKEWKRVFPLAVQVFLERLGSDHKPVLVKLFGQNDSRRGSFRFDKRIVGRQKVRECIDSAWKEGSGAGQQSVIDKLGSVRRSLGKWKRENGNNSKTRMLSIREDLEREHCKQSPDFEKIRLFREEIGKAFKDEEDFWMQKSRDKWLVVGDSNTSFFTPQ